MTRIVVNDATLLNQFKVAAGETDIYDAEGNRLGTYSPNPYLGLVSPHSKEELDRRANEPGGRSLAEFWKAMEQRCDTQ